MAPKKDPIAAALADKMQLRTRKEYNFDEWETKLPDPKLLISPTLASFNPTNILSHLGSRNPLSKPITNDDVVWLFDNTAFKNSRFGSWQAEFVSAVFEREPKCKVVDIVSVIAGLLGLADDAIEFATIEQRLMPFLWDIRPGRLVRALHEKKDLKLGPTGPNGVSSDLLKVPETTPGNIAITNLVAPRGTTGILEMKTHFAAPEGWAIVSDVDDTIKITQTSDPIGILRETFVNPPTPIPGMPELYAGIKSWLPEDTTWFYLSASPYNLYPFLRDFRDQYYPHGTIILRDSSWKTIAGLLSALTLATEEYKVDRLEKIHRWIPKRKTILIGDSTQSDPEAYGELYRNHPEWIKGILIRKAVEISAVGIQEKNEPARFDKAFDDIPREVWHVFQDPAECNDIIKGILKRG